MHLDGYLGRLSFDATEIDLRIRSRLQCRELFGIALGVGMVLGFVYLQPRAFHYDLDNYLRAAQGDFSFYYYAYWLVPILSLLGRLTPTASYTLWSGLSIIAIFLSARVFGGSVSFILVSFQVLYVLFQGQITGLLIGGMAILWWGMAHHRWNIAGMGLLVACTKFQVGVPLGIAMLLLAPIGRRERIRVLILPVIIGILSLIVYPMWPQSSWATIQTNAPNASGSVALWQWMGPAALVFWLPAILLPLPREKRLVALAAAAPLGLPYFQQADLVALFVLPIGGWPLLGNLGFLTLVAGDSALQALVVIPLAVYVSILAPAVLAIVRPHLELARGSVKWISREVLPNHG